MDPLALRRRNALRVGDETSTGQRLDGAVALVETIDAAAERSGWDEKRGRAGSSEKAYGIGASTIMYGVGLGAGGRRLDRAGAFVQIHNDGSVSVAVGTTEMGQGMRTVLSQIAAEALGVPMERVRMLPVDSSRVPDSGPTVASRATLMSGNAILDACRRVREPLLEIAAHMMNENAEDLVVGGGVITTVDGAVSVSLDKVIATAVERRMHLAAQGWFRAPYTSFDENGIGDAYYTYSFMTNIVEVEVDLLTGDTVVKKITSAVDIGQPINPQGVEGQIQGGVLQGMGYGLSEEHVLDGCHIVNPDFSCYIVPTSLDAPEIDPLIVTSAYDKGPYGAKGLGELPLMGVAPAVTNAIYHATGVRVRHAPAKPERVYQGLVALGKGVAGLAPQRS
ncbi:molybdopterin-dependent oxidoreductase, partial [bacterium]|nr:molybdopterin-dependent oxidoreductase [candidate division CSSED10-310 bacterium]